MSENVTITLKKKPLMIGAVVLVGLVLTGALGYAGWKAVGMVSGDSPERVAVDYFATARANDAAKFRTFWATDYRVQVEKLESQVREIPPEQVIFNVMSDVNDNGRVTDVKVVGSEIRGEFACVKLALARTTGAVVVPFYLIRQDGKWLVTTLKPGW